MRKTPRPSPPRRDRKPVAVRKKINAAANQVYFAVDIEPPKLRCVEVEPLNIDIQELTDTTCRQPYGDGPFTFCGHPTIDGMTYCMPHHSLNFQAPTKRVSEPKPFFEYKPERKFNGAWA